MISFCRLKDFLEVVDRFGHDLVFDAILGSRARFVKFFVHRS